MTETTRRLAAILAADVVGYSKLMGADEMATLTAMRTHREEVFEPAVRRNNGRTFKLMGDGTLVEFGSVVDALRCAVEIQIAMAAEADAAGPAIRLRIGVNLGDVIIEGDDVYGDGVNVAARLEPLAEHGGICISAIVKESVGDRIDVSFRDAGEVEVKNIVRPIRIWKWKPGDASDDHPPVAPTPSVPEPRRDGPSIAVLPFDNMSGDPEQEYFSDGISEDIITDLSKVGGLTVIARNSSFAYKGNAVDLRVIGRELGVTSILEGSIRRAGNRVRINAQLIDATTGAHVWAERFDRDLTDIFEVQDEVTLHIVDALKVALTPAEEERVTAPATASTEAYDLFIRAREKITRTLANRDQHAATVGLLERAVALDPEYGEALAALGLVNMFDHLNRWSDDWEHAAGRARAYSLRAVEAAPDEAYPNYVRAVVLMTTGDDHEGALRHTQRALELNPNFAQAYDSLGVAEIYFGSPADAPPFLERSIRLDPLGSQQALHFLGAAHLLAGNFEAAAAAFRERILKFPETDISRSFLASTLGYIGEMEEAHSIWSEIAVVNPRYDFERHMSTIKFLKPDQKTFIRAGLERAGILAPPTDAAPA